MEIAVLIALALLIAVLIGLSVGTRSTGNRAHRDSPAKKPGGTRSCPLCGSTLERGERVRSVFYPSPGDTLAEIHGCRYCEPLGRSPAAGRQRLCPVCRRPVPESGYVIARVFKRPDKTHIHVLGCTQCRTGSKPRGSG